MEIGIRQDGSWHAESLLVLRGVDCVKCTEGTCGPDGKSTDMSAWSKFQEVELVDWNEGDAGDIT